MTDYNTIKVKSKNWPKGHLRASFITSTALAAEVLKLIGANEGTQHVLEPKFKRDSKGRFKQKGDKSE